MRKILLGLVVVVAMLVALPRVILFAQGATPMRLVTAPFQPISLGCAGVGIPDVTVMWDADGDVVFVRNDAPGPAPLSWPWGYSAWMVDGKVEIVKPEGTVLAYGGDRLGSLGGCPRDDGTILVDAGIGGSAITVTRTKISQ